MTATAIVICAILTTAALFVPAPLTIPWPALLFIGSFTVIEQRDHAATALRRAFMIVAPVAVYLWVIWTMVVGTAPAGAMWSGADNSPTAAIYVTQIASRLFLFIVLLHVTVVSATNRGAVIFLRDLSAPLAAKIVIGLTLSTASTIRVAVQKAWLSAVAANVVVPRFAWRNFRHSGTLAGAAWLYLVATVSARLQTKWKIEGTDRHLGAEFSASSPAFAPRDWIWVCAATATTLVSIALALR